MTTITEMGRVVLRDERDEDEGFLRTLHATLRADDPLAGLMPSLIDQQFEMQREHYRTGFPAASRWIVELDGEPIGRLYVNNGDDGVRLLDIALVPAARGRGIGEMLLRRVMTRANASGQPVTLQVEAANPARRLYARLGFRDVLVDGPVVSMRWAPDSPP